MGLSDWIEERANSVQNFASGVADRVASGASAMAGAVQSGIGSAAGAVGATAQAMAERVTDRATSIAGQVAQGATAVASGVQSIAATAAARAEATVSTLTAGVQTTAQNIAGRVQTIAGKAAGGVNAIVGGVASRIEAGIGRVGGVVGQVVQNVSAGVGTVAHNMAGNIAAGASRVASVYGGGAQFVNSLIQTGASFVAAHGGPTAAAAANWVAGRSATAAANIERNTAAVASFIGTGANAVADGVGSGSAFLGEHGAALVTRTTSGLQGLTSRVAGTLETTVTNVAGMVQQGAGTIATGVGGLAGAAAEFANARIARMASNIGSRAAKFAGGLSSIAGGVAELIGQGSSFVAGIVGDETKSIAEFLQARVAAIESRVSGGAARIAGRVGAGAHGIAGLLQQGMAFVQATTGVDLDAMAIRAQARLETMAQNARLGFDFARNSALQAAQAAVHAAQSVADAVMDGPLGPVIKGIQTALRERAEKALANVQAMVERGRQTLAQFAALKAQALAQAMAAKAKAHEMLKAAVGAAREHPLMKAAERGFEFAKGVGGSALAWGADKVKKAANMGRAIVGKGQELWHEYGPTIKAKARGLVVGGGIGAGVGAGVGALFGGPAGALLGGAIGGVVGAGIGLFGAGRPIENDGEMTGPFIPESFAASGQAKSWTGLTPEAALGKGAAVFVNGVHTSAEKHAHSAQRLANETGTVVVGVWNATGQGQGPLGFSRDWAQSLGDKMFGIGDNPAIAKLRWIIKEYGDARKNDGGLRLLAHSQGSIIVSEALRQAREEDGVDIKNNDVTTFGNAIYTVPEGAKYRHYVFSGDFIANATGSLGVGSGSLVSMAELGGGTRAASRDTRVMSHPSWDPVRQHGLDESDGMPDYISATANTVRNEWAANSRWKGQGGFAGLPTKGPALPAAPAFSPYMVLRGSPFSSMGGGGPTIGKRLQGWMPEFAKSWFGGPDQGALDGGSAMPDLAKKLNSKYKVQRQGTGPGPDADPAALRGGLIDQGGTGVSPNGAIQSRLAGAIGGDFAAARLHTGPAAAAAARSLQAEAFTIGRDVFFADGKYDPQSPQGMGLIAHELTHVVQQTSGQVQMSGPGSANDDLEQAARRVGAIVESGFRSGASPHFENVEIDYAFDGSPNRDLGPRLDRISVRAIEDATLRLDALRMRTTDVERLEVDVELDLDQMTDAECVARWSEAIVRAVRFSAQGATASSAPALQLKRDEAGLPDHLKSGVENLSGFAMDGVRAHHSSSRPAALNAHAYAQGTEVHVAPGQERHLPHEAWHVVQQRQGRVHPTLQMKRSGVGDALSGYSLDDARMNSNSSEPAPLNASAYAQGTDIHVAPGQERHLPHEAWHVAQQLGGGQTASRWMEGSYGMPARSNRLTVQLSGPNNGGATQAAINRAAEAALKTYNGVELGTGETTQAKFDLVWANAKKMAGEAGEAAAESHLASRGENARNFNTIKNNSELIDVISDRGLYSVKANDVAGQMYVGGSKASSNRAASNQLKALVSSESKAVALAKSISKHRQELIKNKQWPAGLKPNATEVEIAKYIRNESKLLIPGDQVKNAQEFIRTDATRNPAKYGLDPKMKLEPQLKRLVQRVESLGLDKLELERATFPRRFPAAKPPVGKGGTGSAGEHPSLAQIEAHGEPVGKEAREAAENLAKAQKIGKLAKVVRYGGKILLVVSVAADAYEIYSAEDHMEATAGVAGGWAGAAAAAGAAGLGMSWLEAAPGPGTLAHAVITGAAGIGGYFGGKAAGKAIYHLTLTGHSYRVQKEPSQ